MKTIPFEIKDDYIELIKLLKATGMCSTGGRAKIAIVQGEVQVDGETEFRKRRKIRKGMTVRCGETVIQIL